MAFNLAIIVPIDLLINVNETITQDQIDDVYVNIDKIL